MEQDNKQLKQIECMILSINNFKRELIRQDLMTPKLEKFIEDYMKWDNK